VSCAHAYANQGVAIVSTLEPIITVTTYTRILLGRAINLGDARHVCPVASGYRNCVCVYYYRSTYYKAVLLWDVPALVLCLCVQQRALL
jgi:hypothetical protein